MKNDNFYKKDLYFIVISLIFVSLSFNVLAASPTVNIISPNGGEIWSGTQNLRWTASDSDGDPLNITIWQSPNNGTTWYGYISNTENDGIYEVNTDEFTSWPGDGKSYLFRVLASDGKIFPLPFDDSDSVFIIDNTGPIVNAGTDKTGTDLFMQDATASDSTSGIASYSWTKRSGPGIVTFSSPNSEDTTVSVDTPGTYTIRLTVTDMAGNTAFDEFSILESINRQNLALNKPVTASSEENDAGIIYFASNAVDGNLNTRWSSNYFDSEWIYVDLQSVYLINKSRILWEFAYGGSYRIEVSNDATNWTNIFSTSTGDGNVDDISFSPIEARYVKMNGVARGTRFGYSMHEFEVYGNTSQTSPDPIPENNPPVITVLSPNGGEMWNKIKAINWNASDPDGDVLTITIQKSSNGGTDWQTLTTNENNDGLYSWDTSKGNDGGSYLIRIIASDGQLSSQDDSDSVLMVDNTPPIAGITFLSPYYINESNYLFISSNSAIAINPSDSGSGVYKIYYSLGELDQSGNKIIYNYNGLFKIQKEDSRYIIERWVIDNAGNEGDHNKITFILDNSPPRISLHSDILAESLNGSGSEVEYGLPLADDMTGNITISCSPHSGSLFSQGNTTITCSAVDKLKNRATITFMIYVLQTQENGDGTKTATLPLDIKLNSENEIGVVNIFIPNGTNITGSSSLWTGNLLEQPKIKDNAIVSPSSSSETTLTISKVIEAGPSGTDLKFDKAVKIIILGEAGKLVGYSKGTGDIFHSIINICGENSQTWADNNLLDSGDCKIDINSDLVVWTKHFTEFVTYTQTTLQPPTQNPSSGGGGGGGSGGGGGGGGSSGGSSGNNPVPQPSPTDTTTDTAQPTPVIKTEDVLSDEITGATTTEIATSKVGDLFKTTTNKLLELSKKSNGKLFLTGLVLIIILGAYLFMYNKNK